MLMKIGVVRGFLLMALMVVAAQANAQDQVNAEKVEFDIPRGVQLAEELSDEADLKQINIKIFDRESIKFKIGPDAYKEKEELATRPDDDEPPVQQKNDWYVRPDGKTRARRYVYSIVGPVALVRYTMVAGVLTGRNAPREWGGKWKGFAGRFGSNIAENAINNSVKYGLDEALKVDSRYYLSRNRSVSARMRNAVFSTVMARNVNGDRVFGLPKIAGQLAGNVISASTWYPERYGISHGLKGAAIGLAVDAGVSLFREFIWKK